MSQNLTIGTSNKIKLLHPGPITAAPENASKRPSMVQATLYTTGIFRGWNGALPTFELPDGTWVTLDGNGSIL